MGKFASDLIGKFGRYVTHGSGSIARTCAVLDFIPAGESANKTIEKFAEYCDFKSRVGGYWGAKVTWKAVSEFSAVGRYLIITSQLTKSGAKSKTGNMLLMSPEKRAFEKHFTILPNEPL